MSVSCITNHEHRVPKSMSFGWKEKAVNAILIMQYVSVYFSDRSSFSDSSIKDIKQTDTQNVPLRYINASEATANSNSNYPLLSLM